MNITQLVKESTPKFNPVISRGYVTSQLRDVETYVDNILRSANKSMPEGLVFVQSRRCTPEEQYKESSAKKNGGMRYEFSKSDIYMVRYDFSYKGEPLKPVFICLPFVKDGGLMKIMGSTYSVAPVLADRSISVTSRNIYVPVPRDKLLFQRMTHIFRQNGNRQMGYVFWAKLYRDDKVKVSRAKKTVDMRCAIIHYLLGKFGLGETINRLGLPQMFYGVGYEGRDSYPSDEWTLYETDGVRQRGYKGNSAPTRLWLVCRNRDVSVLVHNFIAALFYIVDHFPDRVDEQSLDAPLRWTRLLAHCIFASRERETVLLDLIVAHQNSVEQYVDIVATNWFKQDGLDIENFYDLIAEIFRTYPERAINAASNSTSMYGRRLLVHRYVLADIVNMIFKTVYVLQTKAKSIVDKGNIPTAADMEMVLKQKFSTRAIIKLNRSNHPEVESVSSPTQSMAYRLTTRTVLQSNISSQGGDCFDAYTMGLDASIAEVANFYGSSKAEPTGRGVLSLYLNVGPTGNIIRDERFRDLIDSTQRLLQR